MPIHPFQAAGVMHFTSLISVCPLFCDRVDPDFCSFNAAIANNQLPKSHCIGLTISLMNKASSLREIIYFITRLNAATKGRISIFQILWLTAVATFAQSSESSFGQFFQKNDEGQSPATTSAYNAWRTPIKTSLTNARLRRINEEWTYYLGTMPTDRILEIDLTSALGGLALDKDQLISDCGCGRFINRDRSLSFQVKSGNLAESYAVTILDSKNQSPPIRIGWDSASPVYIEALSTQQDTSIYGLSIEPRRLFSTHAYDATGEPPVVLSASIASDHYQFVQVAKQSQLGQYRLTFVRPSQLIQSAPIQLEQDLSMPVGLIVYYPGIGIIAHQVWVTLPKARSSESSTQMPTASLTVPSLSHRNVTLSRDSQTRQLIINPRPDLLAIRLLFSNNASPETTEHKKSSFFVTFSRVGSDISYQLVPVVIYSESSSKVSLSIIMCLLSV